MAPMTARELSLCERRPARSTPWRSARGRAARLALVALALAACGSDEAERPGRPNIVLVSIDSLRPDHLGCYGYSRATSPFLDELAAAGVRWTNALSTTSWTLPAHAALLTGLADTTHGVVDNGLRLNEEHATLAEILKDAGYHTAGFYGGPYLAPVFGFAQGFDVYESCMTPAAELALPHPNAAQHAASHADVTGPRTRARVASWAAERARSGDDRPYFLFLHLWDVHYDFVAPREYVELFDPDYAGSIDGRLMDDPAIAPTMSERDRAHLLALYDAEIRFTDDVLRGIFADLAEHGLSDDTLTLVTADHGEEFFEHGGKGHNKTLFDEVVRVPLILHWPEQVPAGRVRSEQVQLIDVAPTLAFAAGLREPLAVQGQNLAPTLAAASLPPRPALLELSIDRGHQRALRTLDHKIYRPAARTPASIFDLASDPGEYSPRKADAAAEAQLTAALERARELAKLLGAREADAIALTPELEEALERLGYLGSGEPRANPRAPQRTSSPMRPAWKSAMARWISSFVFMTKGPWPTIGSSIGSPLSSNARAPRPWSMRIESPPGSNTASSAAPSSSSPPTRSAPRRTTRAVWNPSGTAKSSAASLSSRTSHTWMGVKVRAGPATGVLAGGDAQDSAAFAEVHRFSRSRIP